jgi:iron complex transport system ATP-binding protein
VTLLRARGLDGGYGGRTVVRGIDLEVTGGRCIALLGPNGAGKTTLVRLLAGVLPAERGVVEVLGRPLQAWRRREVAREVALVPQQVHFTFPLTVREVIEQGRAPHLGPWRPPGPDDHAAVAEAIARLDLAGLADAPVQRLSGGERQRVVLARALATRARVLLLDEPAAALDLRHQLDLAAMIARLRGDGVGVVMVVHDWNLALQLADELVVLQAGRVVAAGRPEETLRPELFAAVFGVEVEILRGRDGRPVVVPRAGSTAGV